MSRLGQVAPGVRPSTPGRDQGIMYRTKAQIEAVLCDASEEPASSRQDGGLLPALVCRNSARACGLDDLT
jgi:hypothetical protein